MIKFLKEKVFPIVKWFGASFIWVFIIMLVLDIVSKVSIKSNMVEGQAVDLIPGFLRIRFVLNERAAFGIGPDNPLASRIIYLVIASIASIAILIFYIKGFKKINGFTKGCLMLILTGAIGNMVDRIFFGPAYAVVDFIDFYFISWWNFVFNIADCCVVIGAILLIVYLIVSEVKDYLKRRKAEEVEFQGQTDKENK